MYRNGTVRFWYLQVNSSRDVSLECLELAQALKASKTKQANPTAAGI